MIKKIFALAAGTFACYAAAASAVVFTDEPDVKPTKEPAYFYAFAYPEGGSASFDTTDVNGAKVLDFVAPKGTDSEGAGFGFAWQQNPTTYKDIAVSLSAYKGVCLVYEADYPFRVDFKQSTITDDNFYGYEVGAAASPRKLFIAFADLTQGWKSSTAKAWSVTSQTGVQFSYKNTHANVSKSESNTVILHSFTLADGCPNHTPVYSGAPATIDITEGTDLAVPVASWFSDEDGEELVYTVKIVSATGSATASVSLAGTAVPDASGDIYFKTVSNPKEDAKVVITATDGAGAKAVSDTILFVTKDVDNDPVAKDFSFEVLEDSSYKNSLINRLTLLGSDADGDAIVLEKVSDPLHGSLSLDESTGLFTYRPNKDFYGEDSFTYRFVAKDNAASVSNVATAHVKVVNVNDAPSVKVVNAVFYEVGAGMALGDEHKFGDTLVVDEDFDTLYVAVKHEDFLVEDPDGADDYTISTKVSGVVSSEITSDGDNYLVSIVAKPDDNGIAKITLNVADPKITIPTVLMYVKVNPVMDAPTPVDDSYDVVQDSVNTVKAAKGVLANDKNPDGADGITAVLKIPASCGTVELAADGSFTYDAQGCAVGEDAFGYVLAYGDADTTAMAVVSLSVKYKNKAPVVVDGVADTVGGVFSALTEDFTTLKKYSVATIRSWFKDDQDTVTKLKFTARSKDSLTSPSITTYGLQLDAVKNACGDATVILTATDTQGASTDLEIPVSIACVNDKPVVLVENDTVYIPLTETWSVDIDVSKYVADPDGDELVYTPNIGSIKKVAVSMDGSILTVSSIEGKLYEEGYYIGIGVKVSDPAETAVTVNVFIKLGEDPNSIAPVIASPKMNWQGAIQASYGKVTMMDMQGRVMWTRRLPVSESEVRAAAASVQGRKILKVNSQTYTIK